MKQNSKLKEGKNGLRNYSYESAQKNKVTSHYNRDIGHWKEEQRGMFYMKHCVFCKKSFEARRIDTTFCCQGCQKAHLRQRKQNR